MDQNQRGKFDAIHMRSIQRMTVLGGLNQGFLAPGLGVCEWSPEGLYDKRVSWILNTDEILKLLKKKEN